MNTKHSRYRFGLATLVVALCFGQTISAAQVAWVDWTAANATSATGMAAGIMVNFSGNLDPPAQTAGGTYYWGVSSSTYTASPVVDNPPPDPDIIRLTGGTGTSAQTLTFSEPVVDPVMAVLGLGTTNQRTTYDFDTPFDVLNVGPGVFGEGSLVEQPCSFHLGHTSCVLEGREGHGIIQFRGRVSSISWTMPIAEVWHGFQIAVVPEPSSCSLAIAASLVLLGLARRR